MRLRRFSERGFTLIEVLIVVTLVVILASVGMATYTNAVQRAREAVLREDLFRMRDWVQAGTLDEARELQRRLTPIARSIGGIYGVAGLKAALDLLGFAGGPPRPPLRHTPSCEPIAKKSGRMILRCGLIVKNARSQDFVSYNLLSLKI